MHSEHSTLLLFYFPNTLACVSESLTPWEEECLICFNMEILSKCSNHLKSGFLKFFACWFSFLLSHSSLIYMIKDFSHYFVN